MPNITLSRLWPGETVVIIASGPSLTQADVDAVRGRARTVVVNDNYRKAPWADVLYAADVEWWNYHAKARRENDQTPWTQFPGMKLSIGRKNASVGTKHHAHLADVGVLKNTGMEGLELKPDSLKHGMNSGAQAIGVAYHLGAARILLLGYDCKMTGGEAHWFGHHPSGLRRDSPYSSFKHCFELMAKDLTARGVEVVNCSRETSLTCFRRSTIDAALPVALEVAS